MIPRGQDWDVTVMRDSVLLASFRANTSVAIDFGIGVETEHYVGDENPTVFGVNGAARFDCPLEPSSPEFAELAMLQREANRSARNRTPLRIDCSAAVDFGAEGRFRVQFPGCIMHDAALNVSGGMGRTTATPSFTCSKPVRL